MYNIVLYSHHVLYEKSVTVEKTVEKLYKDNIPEGLKRKNYHLFQVKSSRVLLKYVSEVFKIYSSQDTFDLLMFGKAKTKQKPFDWGKKLKYQLDVKYS